MAGYDVIIIGAGPGGYVAAIRAAQLGINVALVERDEVGGICLNWGCIPSKALLRNAEIVNLINERSQEFGITFDNVSYDFAKAVERSRVVVRRLVGGVKALLKKNGVEHFQGSGYLKSATEVEIRDTGQTLTGKNVIIATGTRPRSLPMLPDDREMVITSREALELKEVPSAVAIVGGGATGAEFAYIYNAYGATVTIAEMLPHLVPLEDEDVSQRLEKAFSKQGIQVKTGAQVTGLSQDGGRAKLKVATQDGEEEIECDKVLVAVGISGNVEELGLEAVGVETERGFVVINDRMMTNVPGVYAIGDVTGKMALAHVASAQGVVAVEIIAGIETPPLDYTFMPRATYCQPQVASFGLTEKQAREKGHDIRVGTFPFQASGKAIALGDTEGMVKLVSDNSTGEIIGAHMVGSEVTELLGELSLARLLEGTTIEVGALVHPHPTLSEVLKEAALSADGQAIHI